MLGRKGELRSRLLRHVVPLPYIYIGQHWRGDPRSRWSAVMSSRFLGSSGAGQAPVPDWLPSPARNSDGKSCGFAFLV